MSDISGNTSEFCAEGVYQSFNPSEHEVIQVISFILLGIGNVYVLLSTARFMYYRPKYERLRKREKTSLYLTMCSSLVFLNIQILNAAVHYSCFVFILGLCVAPTLPSVSVLLRLHDFYVRSMFSKLIAYRFNARNGMIGGSSGDKLDSNSAKSTRTIAAVSVSLANAEENNPPSPQKSRVGTKEVIEIQTRLQNIMLLLSIYANPDKHRIVSDEILLYLRFFSTPQWAMCIIFMTIAPYLSIASAIIVQKKYLRPQYGCVGCAIPIETFIIILSYCFLLSILLMSIAYKLRNSPDPFGILREQVMLCCIAIFATTAFVCMVLIPDGFSEYFSISWVYWVFILGTHFTVVDLQVFLAQKRHKEEEAQGVEWRESTKDQSRIESNHQYPASQRPVSSGNAPQVNIGKVTPMATATEHSLTQFKQLINESITPHSQRYLDFEKSLASEFSTELLFMYEEILRFKASYYDMSAQTKISRVKKIYQAYVATNAVTQVNLSAKNVEVIGNAANTHNADSIQITLFDSAASEIIGMMHGAYLRFVKKKN